MHFCLYIITERVSNLNLNRPVIKKITTINSIYASLFWCVYKRLKSPIPLYQTKHLHHCIGIVTCSHPTYLFWNLLLWMNLKFIIVYVITSNTSIYAIVFYCIYLNIKSLLSNKSLWCKYLYKLFVYVGPNGK
jgi:hypothetical protein